MSTAQSQQAAHLPLTNIDVLQYKVELWLHDLDETPVDFDAELRIRVVKPSKAPSPLQSVSQERGRFARR